MPIYEFQCRKCGHCFETLVLGRSEQPPACPKCGETEVDRRISAACVIGASESKGCVPGKGFS